MTTAAPIRSAPPDPLAVLAERFDPEVIDVPGGRARIRLADPDGDDWDALIRSRRLRLEPADQAEEPDALLSADAATWRRMARDLRGGMDAFRRRRLVVRHNLHLGVGFLAATSGITDERRMRFHRVRTPAGSLSVMEAGQGPAVVCVHGLGGTKASFLPTLAALADSYRVIALDLPGFGESDKPIGARYDAAWFADNVVAALDGLGIGRANLVGNSMGGRIAIEAGLREPRRVRSLTLLSPALAWLRGRRWAPFLRLVRPELGLLQPAPRPVVEAIVRRMVPGGGDGWQAAGVDEFLRSFLTGRGRAAFYASARNIYLDKPHGEEGFWSRLERLSPRSLFVWGRQDMLVPVAFMKHVERCLPAAEHLELDCGHVPQLEAPAETHAAIRRFIA